MFAHLPACHVSPLEKQHPRLKAGGARPPASGGVHTEWVPILWSEKLWPLRSLRLPFPGFCAQQMSLLTALVGPLADSTPGHHPRGSPLQGRVTEGRGLSRVSEALWPLTIVTGAVALELQAAGPGTGPQQEDRTRRRISKTLLARKTKVSGRSADRPGRRGVLSATAPWARPGEGWPSRGQVPLGPQGFPNLLTPHMGVGYTQLRGSPR